MPGSDQKAFGPSSVCSWDTFEFDERLYALASRGCGWLNGLDDVDQLDLSCKTATGNSCAPSVDAFTVGLWDFTQANTYGNQAMKTNAFINNALVCGHDQCNYSRAKQDSVGCKENFDLQVSPASFQDSSGKLGPAVLTGPLCISNTDWDRPPEDPLSVYTFIMNNGNVEAVQFDGSLNRGLYVAENIDGLVDGTEASSKRNDCRIMVYH